VTAKEPAPATDGSPNDRERDSRGEPRTRWRDPRTRTPRPWRADADMDEPAGRGKQHRPRGD
jgi:hypothetical protein